MLVTNNNNSNGERAYQTDLSSLICIHSCKESAKVWEVNVLLLSVPLGQVAVHQAFLQAH